jgi:hypothetical protein
VKATSAAELRADCVVEWALKKTPGRRAFSAP